MKNLGNNTRLLVITALLSAIGIAIPMYCPIKIIIGPASFTMASHLPVFFGMFIGTPVGVTVALISSLGFFLGGFPIVIVMRALSHIAVAAVGGFILGKRPNTLNKNFTRISFSAFIGLIHGLLEVLMVLPFYYAGKLSEASYTSGFMVTVVLLVGVGTFVHSMVDFEISCWLRKALSPILTFPTTAEQH